MYLIVGLGNPDRQYEGTRHNVGFEVIDQLADRLFVSVEEKKFRGYYGKGVIGGQKVILFKASDLYEPERRERSGGGGFL